MNNLSKFIKNRDLELTLLNEAGEFTYIGKVHTIKSFDTHNKAMFKSNGRPTNRFPFTTAVLHSGKRVFETLVIKPVRFEQEKEIELVW